MRHIASKATVLIRWWHGTFMERRTNTGVFGEQVMNSRLAYTIAEAGKVSNTGRTVLYEEIKAGRLRAVKRGRRTLILADDLRRWLEALPALSKEIA
jgi:excisionase family DNA binding protein